MSLSETLRPEVLLVFFGQKTEKCCLVNIACPEVTGLPKSVFLTSRRRHFLTSYLTTLTLMSFFFTTLLGVDFVLPFHTFFSQLPDFSLPFKVFDLDELM